MKIFFTDTATTEIYTSALALGACQKKAPEELPPAPINTPTPTPTATTGTSTGASLGTQAHFEQAVGSSTVIYFDTDRFNIDTTDAAALQAQAQYFAQYPQITFTIEGHCDERGTIGYWKLSDGPIASGSYEAGAFRFEDATQHVGVDATDGHPGCVVERREVIEGALVQGVTHDGAVGGADAGVPHDGGGDGEPRDGFDGTTTVRITPTAGSECSLLLQPQGGAFPALPCGFSYRLRGTRLEEPLW